MPAYNAAGFIAEAIDSVVAQTVTGWELIVVDDGSTDNTADIAARYADTDPRIRLLRMPAPSGSAYQPRKLAIEETGAEIVAPLDADDRVDPDYLRRLLDRMRETDADIVYPMMCHWVNGSPLLKYPDGITSQYGRGREYLKYTLDGWRIACNGGLIRRDLYISTYSRYDSSIRHSCADELLTRQLLLGAVRVAVTDVKYYYRDNPGSITRRPSGKLFDFMINNRELISLTRENYGKDSEEHRLAQRQNLNGIFDAMRLLNRLSFSRADRRRALSMAADCRRIADMEILRGCVSRSYMLLFRLPPARLRMALKIADPLRPLWKLSGGARYSLSRLRGSAKVRRGLPAPDSLDTELTARLYSYAGSPAPEKRGVICMLDGEIAHGGLTDRIRGILSAYSECRRRGIPFYIYWISPFELTDYLIPATFDWRISPGEICRDLRYARPVAIDDMTDFQSRIRLRAALAGRPAQLHLYTNVDFARGDYARLYREIFRPSPTLEREVERHRARLGKRYWNVAARFLTLLGDFTDSISSPLPPEEGKALIDKVSAELLKIIAQAPQDATILLTSDSRRFLEHARNLDPRIYIVEGEVQHVDLNRDAAGDVWMKTFVDQMLIMGAETVVRLRTGGMYPSGFPRFAAETGGARFIDHQF